MRNVVSSLAQKISNLTVAFVLASSTMLAVPFALTQSASAAINDEVALQAKLSSGGSVVELTQDITLTQSLILNRSNVTIDGQGHTITGPNLGGVWVSNGDNYVLKVYKATGIVIKNVTFTGANAGLQVNGSKVTLDGTVNVSGNAFGGIEVTQGNGVTDDTDLTITGTLQNASESPTKPSIWVDANGTNVTVSAPGLSNIASAGKPLYFKSSSNAQIVAYANLQASIDAANSGDTVTLTSDITLPVGSFIAITKPITLEGNGHTITNTNVWQPGAAGNGTTDYAIQVTSPNGVTIQNLTIVGTATPSLPQHPAGAINLWQSAGAVIKNVTSKNNAVAVAVIGSQATVENITSSGSTWGYVINVDQTGASLAVAGTNSWNEASFIYSENDSQVTFDDSSLYEKTVVDGKATYVKKAIVVEEEPVIVPVTPPAPTPATPVVRVASAASSTETSSTGTVESDAATTDATVDGTVSEDASDEAVDNKSGFNWWWIIAAIVALVIIVGAWRRTHTSEK